MATASQVTKESKILKCPVCITKFDNPRILPCLHTICEKCIRDNIESKGQSNAQCPICKTLIVLSDGSLDFDKWIDGFIPDSTIKSLIDTTEILDNKDDRCDPCKRENENATSEIWCLDCKEKLCGSCMKYHKRNKVSLHHKTVPVNEREKQRPALNFERTCPRHPGKPLELFCADHRELCCILCFASNHRECNNIRGIDDFVREQPTGLHYKVLDDLMKIKTEMNKVITDKKENIVQLAQEKAKISNDMDTVVYRIFAKLNELRKSSQDEAEHLHENGEISILKYHRVIQRFVVNIENVYRILEIVEELGSPRQKFIMLETVCSQITSHHQQLKNDLKDDAKVNLTLKPNNVLQDITTLDSLGQVKVTLKTNTVMEDSLNNIDDNIKTLNSRTQLSAPLCPAQVGRSRIMTSSVTLVKTLTRQNLGMDTFVMGGTFLLDGRLVMTDNNNSRLLQLDNDYNIVRKHKLDGNPRDITAGNNQNEIYISLGLYPGEYIDRCTLDTHLTITQRIKAPLETWSIAVSGNTIIAGAYDAVSLLSLDGSTVKSLPKSRGDSCVAVSHTPPSFYHGDGHSVICRTFDGKELFRYNNDKLKYVKGICVHNNNVYVCGRDSHNVHRISCDGQKSRILLYKLHSISRPWTVFFNQQKNELIVTSYNENTVIEVYRLN